MARAVGQVRPGHEAPRIPSLHAANPTLSTNLGTTGHAMHPIYLDHNATTPIDPEVLEAMRPHFLAGGNAESRHAFGRSARRAWESARETVARILGADPSEVIFTSGGPSRTTWRSSAWRAPRRRRGTS